MDTRWRIPPGQLVRQGVLAPLQTDHRQQLLRLRVLLDVSGLPADLQRQADVVDGAAPGQERRVLEDEGEVARPSGLARRAPEDTDGAAGDRHEIRDGPEQRRLAAARGPQHGDESALRNLEADPVQRGDAAGLRLEADRQLPHRDCRGGGGFSARRRGGCGRHPICFLSDSVADRISVVITSSTVGVSPLNCPSFA